MDNYGFKNCKMNIVNVELLCIHFLKLIIDDWMKDSPKTACDPENSSSMYTEETIRDPIHLKRDVLWLFLCHGLKKLY